MGRSLSKRNNEPRELVSLLEGKRLLAEAKTLDDILKIRDQAEAMRAYLRKRDLGLEIQNDAAEIKIRAERSAGEMLLEMPKQHGARDGKTGSHRATPLSDIGVSKTQSSRWQAIAKIEESKFEQQVESARSSGKELTTAAFLRAAPTEPKTEEPKEWDLHENLVLLQRAVYSVYERWPQEWHDVLSSKLISLGEELRDKGTLRE
jgi:hypothetical protein